ncbi:MAG: hypothetical protein K6G15_01230 [Desulfovibrio sp.]|nr:hypothetical protein [Desulfovibrio sp.]
MKGGGMLGGLVGLLGAGLLSKGAIKGGTSLLGTLGNLVSSSGRGGMKKSFGGQSCPQGGSGRRGGGRGCARVDMDKDNVLTEVLQQALQYVNSQQHVKELSTDEPSSALPKGQSEEVIEIQARAISAADPEQQKAALALLTAYMVSYLPGRARVRHEALKNQNALLKLQHSLLHAGFSEVELKASTGSALLIWDAEVWDKAAFLAAALPLGMYLLEHEDVA